MAITPVIRTAEYQVESAVESEQRRRGGQQDPHDSKHEEETLSPEEAVVEEEQEQSSEELELHSQILDTSTVVQLLNGASSKPNSVPKNVWMTKQRLTEKLHKLK